MDETIDTRPIMVSIRCATYNHAPYIRQCLDGFIMQKTNFRFEAIVHDDASTDGTTEILREYAEKYPDIIKPMFETENQYSKGLLKMNDAINKRLTGKYVALCEGDDYWTDSLKLQKQVDFLENNPDYSLVRTNVDRYHQKEGWLENDYFSHSKRIEDTKEFYIMHTLWLATCTWLFRNIYMNRELDYSRGDVFYGDIYILLNLSRFGMIKYMDESMAVYRILDDSASHFKSWKSWFIFSWKCKNTRLMFAVDKPFHFKVKFWVMEFLRVGYRAIRSLDPKCMAIASKSIMKDFGILFCGKSLN